MAVDLSYIFLNEIDATPILTEMHRIWRSIFNDSDSYIDRILRCWTDSDYSLIAYDHNTHIVCAMLCAHTFQFTHKNRGLYLHGLATLPQYRNKGIMAHMIELCRNNAVKNNLDFLFLVPADGGLRSYYSNIGFIDMTPRQYAFLPRPPKTSTKTETLRRVLYLHELQQPAVSIIHSDIDLNAIVEEWQESGGEIYSNNGFTFKSDDKIAAIDSENLIKTLKSHTLPIKTYLMPLQVPAVAPHFDIFSEPYAMAYPLNQINPTSIYVNLLMD